MWQAVTKEEKVFSPWDLDEFREIKNGLGIVMRKKEGVGADSLEYYQQDSECK